METTAASSVPIADSNVESTRNVAADTTSSNGQTPSTSNGQKPRAERPKRDEKGGNRGRGKRGGRIDKNGSPDKKHKRRDVGRSEWSRNYIDRRARNDAEQANKKRRQDDGGALPIYATTFSKQEIENEDRKPKRKVAVLIGYSGSGYKGMQLNTQEKTIEGELFHAFVVAGAISKANADDPKKSSLVRCARTDKGVHAAGNVISLKLIIEDAKIVEKINNALPPQIRVWGIERTNNSFSCYQTCESRIYEYLIPTHSLLPPHPSSFLGKRLRDIAEECGDLQAYESRQEEVKDFWADTEKKYIKPILDELDDQTRSLVLKALYNEDANKTLEDAEEEDDDEPVETTNKLADPSNDVDSTAPIETTATVSVDAETPMTSSAGAGQPCASDVLEESKPTPKPRREPSPLETATKALKAALLAAKRSYRVSPVRLERLRSVLGMYVGTHNFHSYTVQKSFKDVSATRIIKSFTVSETPIIIGETEWLSLKVHGQSFMMHQIRKMVGMASLIVRCGTDPSLIKESYGPTKLSIPKAPGLGLLLERPFFPNYNERAVTSYGRRPITFEPYEKEIDEFKNREIYKKIWETEERKNVFHTFFSMVDMVEGNEFLFLSSKGVEAVAKGSKKEGSDANGNGNEVVEGEAAGN